MRCARSASIADHRIDVAALVAIAIDREVGFKPFLVVATAGTVDIGAVDDLKAIAELCREEGIWFHVDGAFGALAILSPELAPLLEVASSLRIPCARLPQMGTGAL